GNTTITDTINKANATVVVDAYTVTYDGHAHLASVVSITGVNGETGVTVGAVDVSHTDHTAAGTYAADYWFFTATANYNDIGNTTITDTINQKALDVTANDQSKTYGATFTFAGTEFTTGAGQLVMGDAVASVTLTSTGAAATATVSGSPYDIAASNAVGT